MNEKRFPACVLGTVVLPWTDDWRFAESVFRQQVSALLATGYRHLYIFGTAGEGYAVTDRQFRHIVGVFVDAMRASGADPMVGVISLSQATVIERIATAHELGVRQFQLSFPSWGALDEAEMRRFFDAVLGRFPDCQFLHYNLQRAHRIVSGADYASVAADHPNLVATKNSTDSMARIRDLLERAPMLQHFLNERGFAFASLFDECGLLISVATTNLRLGQEYFGAGRARDVATLLRMQGEIERLARGLAAAVPGVRMDGAYDKLLWRLHQPEFPLRLLPPYAGATAEAVEAYAAFVRAELPHWTPEVLTGSVR